MEYHQATILREPTKWCIICLTMINIKHFSKVIADEVGVDNAQVIAVINAAVERVVKGVDDGEIINISKLGRFWKVIRKGRNCRNPITSEPMRWEDVPMVRYSPANKFTKTIRK